MVVVKFNEFHEGTAAWAFKRVITEGGEDTVAPAVERKEYPVLLLRNGTEEFMITLPVAGIDAIVAYLLKMLFRDMLDETVYEIECGDGFHDQAVIFMAVIVEGDHITVIMINAGSGNDGSAEIASDIFSHSPGVTFIGFCVNIKTVFVVSVDRGFDLFERRSDLRFQFIEECSLEGVPHEAVVEVGVCAPETVVSDTAFRDKTVDMRIPFEVTAKGVKDTDKTWGKALRFIIFMEHA